MKTTPPKREITAEERERWARWFSWRTPRSVLPLHHFDRPELKHRTQFDASALNALANHRMAGVPVKDLPKVCLRDAIQSGEFPRDVRSYLDELWHDLSMFEMKFFYYHCEISFYELARAMLAIDYRHWCNVDFVNKLVPGYQSPVERLWIPVGIGLT